MKHLPVLPLILIASTSAAAPPGVVIAHSPAASKQYIGSPSLALLPNGDFVASHDFFMAGDNGDTTVVYASTDRGQTWAKRTAIKGQWWSTLFVHREKLYLMGVSKARGFCVIRRSTDGGKTWTEPKDANSGLLHGDGMYHCAPVPVLEHNGRLWRGMEDGTGPKGWDRKFNVFMMSAPVDADLLKATSWTSSNRLPHTASWLDGKFGGWLEGNAVAAPTGEVLDILRVQQPGYPERAALVRISADGKTATFDPAKDFMAFPGGGKKFTIRSDAKSKLYWALANHIPKEFEGPNAASRRNTLALIASADLRTWEVKRIVLQHPDIKTHGFQYADWQFDGDDLIAVVRTAFNEADGTQAHNAHDANFLTFHRITNFCTTLHGLGQLSEKYESGGRGPGTVSTGKGDPGGVSYGTYQLASKVGRADEFVKRYYPDEFKGLTGGMPEFTAKWKELAAKDPDGLRANERAFIEATHYDPQVKKLAKDLGLDVAKRSAALRDVVWSTAVQHGPNTDVIVVAVKPLVKGAIDAVTDEAIIRAVYAERGRKTADGKLARFRNVSNEWIPALTKRFESELQDALAMLAK